MKDKTFMRIVLGEILASGAVLAFLIASAVIMVLPQRARAENTTSQTVSQGVSAVSTTNCTIVSRNLYFGASDRFLSGNNVAKLQSFLISRGYLNANATGFYGTLTFSAVRNFQRDNGILAIGQAGPLTRGYIQKVSCGSGTIPPVGQSPSISSISPSVGTVGTIVTVYGSGFSSNSTVNFSGAFGPNVQILNSNTLSFRIPERLLPSCAYGNVICLIYGPAVEPGIYQISVKNNNVNDGTSNSVNFTVTSATPNPNTTPVINGIDSPSILSVNQSGTWVVRATNVTGGGLSYRVVWGDEHQYGQYFMTTTASENFTQSATFTHTYSQAGVYTPRFYVKGSNGMTAEVSATVQVTGNNNQPVNQTVSTNLGSTVTVNTGSSNTSLRITPIRIVEDSRCAAGLYCFQAGRVVVETNIQSGDMIRVVNLVAGSYTGGSETQGMVVVDGYTIQITGVSPEARQGGISSNEYVVTYRVTR